jgi:hypothetical protein
MLTSYSISKAEMNKIIFTIYDNDDNRIMNWSSEIASDLDMELPGTLFGTTLVLPLYPQEIQRTQSIKTDIMALSTYTGSFNAQGYAENWGMGLPKWTIKAHTGYKARYVNNVLVDGYTANMAIHNFFTNYAKENLFRLKTNGAMSPVKILFHNVPDTWQDLWFVVPESLPVKNRNIEHPLFYNYQLSLVGIVPFADSDVVFDNISNSVTDMNGRVSAIASSLSNVLLTATTIALIVPGVLLESYNAIIINARAILVALTNNEITNSILLAASTTLTSIGALEILLLGRVSSGTSQLYNVINYLKYIKCAMRTLVALPIDSSDSYNDSINNLIDSVNWDGCGTTINIGRKSINNYGDALK